LDVERQSRLYRALAEKYKLENVNQSWLCYENAMFYCQKEPDDGQKERFCQECRAEMEFLEMQPGFSVARTAIVILSYNHGDLTRACIESIRQNNSPESYDLVVVDNSSSDGIQQWLREQKDVCFLENQVNHGFPYGCNQGIALADDASDILLLNNDTLVPENAIFWLRMGLYQEELIGATGSVSNNVVNYQQVSEQYDTVEEWMTFAHENNVPMEYPFENKSWLVGFAMLIKRTALKAVLEREPELLQTEPYEYLDTRFSPGNFEDNDLSIRLLLAGYRLRLIKNSFIYHYGSKAFQKFSEQYLKLLEENRRKLEEKYGMDLIPASEVESALINMIKPVSSSFRVLEIGCKLGATLARIESRYHNAQVLGIEKNELLARLARQVVPVVWGDFPGDFLVEEGFDYIVLDGSLSSESSAVLRKAASCLKPGGSILATVYNAQCIRESGGGRRKSGMTLDELTRLCNDCNLQIQAFQYRSASLTEKERSKVVELCGSWDSPLRPLYEAEKFVFSMK
jgi:GT2 family glycosyltransferase